MLQGFKIEFALNPRLKELESTNKAVWLIQPRLGRIWLNRPQWSTEGRRSTAVAEDFSPTATALAAEGLKGRRPKFRPKAKNFSKIRTKILKSWAKTLPNLFGISFSEATFFSFGFPLLHES